VHPVIAQRRRAYCPRAQLWGTVNPNLGATRALSRPSTRSNPGSTPTPQVGMLSSLLLVAAFILLFSSDTVTASPAANTVFDARAFHAQLSAGATCNSWTALAQADYGEEGENGAAFEYKCAGGSVSDKMPTSTRAVITRSSCQSWCQPLLDAAAGSSCCELSYSADGDHCTWSDGKAEPTDNEAANRATSVLTSCASRRTAEAASGSAANSNSVSNSRAAEVHASADKRYEDEYVCEDDGKKLLDAIGPFDCGTPGDCGTSECCCSQVYLPKGLWKIAQKYGVTQGSCADKGWTIFAWQGVHAGVHYNVYGNPLNVSVAKPAVRI
jgi:hypothetical protein